MDSTLKIWIKGLGNSKGILHMIMLGWCLELVLAVFTKATLEPIVTCLLKHLTWKTILLLTITSTHRASKMHALSWEIPYLRFSNAGITVFTKLSFLLNVATK